MRKFLLDLRGDSETQLPLRVMSGPVAEVNDCINLGNFLNNSFTSRTLTFFIIYEIIFVKRGLDLVLRAVERRRFIQFFSTGLGFANKCVWDYFARFLKFTVAF